jgi:phage terminase large subunit-like protein
VTPNLNRSVTLPRLIEEFGTAQEKGPEEMTRWASQHLNIQLGAASLLDHWVGADFWQGSADPTLNLHTLIQRSEVAVVGVDDGGMDDLLGLTVIGREKGTQNWLSWSRAWAHPKVFERRKNEAERLRDFEKQGDLVVVESLFDAAEQVTDIIEIVNDAGLLPQELGVGQDQYGPRTLVMGSLASRGFDVEKLLLAVPQSWKLTGAIKDTEVRLADGLIYSRRSAYDGLVCRQCPPRAARQRRPDHKAGVRRGKNRPALAALLAGVVVMSMNPTMDDTIPSDFELMVI